MGDVVLVGARRAALDALFSIQDKILPPSNSGGKYNTDSIDTMRLRLLSICRLRENESQSANELK